MKNNFNNKNSKKKILSKVKINFYNEIKKYSKSQKPTDQIEGFASNAIVGEKNYPNLKIHSISNINIENNFFQTSNILKKDYNQIIKLKAKNILGSTSNLNIKNLNNRIQTEINDIYKSKKPVEFSSKFEKEIKFDKIITNRTNGIIGSFNNLKSLNSNQNTQTSKQIEKYIENDIKSSKAIINLYERKINEHQIINLLALGNFGIQINKKLVPTKWAISTYDQIIEKYLFKKIKELKIINTYQIFEYNDKGNKFLIILFPEEISGQTIEEEKDFFGNDYFNQFNKLDKPTPSITGAYYANKMAIFEYLNSIKKQASFLSIRIINNYEIPLGVVFVRECIRNAMKNKINEFSNQNELEKYLFEYKKEFFRHYLKSKIRNNLNKQKKLSEFII